MVLRKWMAGLVLASLVPCASAADDLFIQLSSTDDFESLSAPPVWLPASPANSVPASPVSEPEPFAMMLAGLGLVGTIVRKHRRIRAHKVW